MADSSIVVDSGTGPSVDTRTVVGGDHRQVIVVGDPVTDTAVAPVTAADGLLVNLGTNNDVVISDGGGSITVDAPVGTPVRVDPTGTTIQPVSGTVTANAGSGTFTTSDTATLVDDAGFTPATSRVMVAGFAVDEAATDALDEGDAGAARIDASRRILTRIVGATDANRLDVDASGHAQVDIAALSTTLPVRTQDGSGNAITSTTGWLDVNIAGGSLPGSTQYTEDAPAAADPVGTALNLIREDARAGGLTSLDGDNVAARGTNAGELYVKHVDTIPVTQSGTWNVNNVAGTVSLPTGASTLAEQQTQTTHLATIAGDTTSIQTAVELIDDTVATLGTVTYTEAATKGLVIAGVRRDADTSAVNTDNEAAPLLVNAIGALKVEVFDGGDSHTVDNATLAVVGGGTEATALRVTIASDSTGVLSIDDNAGSLTVDGTVTANLAAGTNNIGDVDVLSVVPGTGATNLGKAIDTATGATDTGVLALATRDDALAALTPIDGDNVQLRTNARGATWVSIEDGAGGQITTFGGGTQYTEADTDASITGTAVMWEDAADTLRVASAAKPLPVEVIAGATSGTEYIDDTSTHSTGVTSGFAFLAAATPTDGSVDANDLGVVAMTTDRRLHTSAAQSGTWNVNNVAGTVSLPTGASTLAEQQTQTGHLATIAGDTTSIQTAVELLDDVVATLGTTTYTETTSKGGFVAAVRRDADTTAVNTDNEAAPLLVNAIGALKVEIFDGGDSHTVDGTVTANLAAGTNNIGDVDVLSIVPGTGATNLGKAEDGGHTTGDTGVYNLGVRNDTPNTALTNADADYASLTTDRVGGIRTALYETDFAVLGTNHVKKYYTSAGAVTDGIVWSPAAGKRWYVTDIFINVSAAATVTLEDDLVAGDSAVWKAELAANSGWSHSFHTPLFSGEDAADLIVTTSAGNVYITVTGYEI